MLSYTPEDTVRKYFDDDETLSPEQINAIHTAWNTTITIINAVNPQDTTDLEDGTVVRMAQHSFFKVSNLGGWISYTGNTHSDEEMAKILKSTIAPIHVYVH